MSECIGFNAQSTLIIAVVTILASFGAFYYGLWNLQFRPRRHAAWLGWCSLSFAVMAAALGWHRVSMWLICGA